jgi:putative thiamine transport system permease protein
MLALPHAAFAIGLLLLISPSGWLVRTVVALAPPRQKPWPWPLAASVR